jgi:K+-transporting ATPase ATPase C chain
MNEITKPDGGRRTIGQEGDQATTGARIVRVVLGQLRPAVCSVALLTLVTGIVFPLLLAALARPLFPGQAGGSLVIRDRVVGSELIGQDFTGQGYFQPRPSAAGRGYDGTASGGTNLAPANHKLVDGARDDSATRDVDESFAGMRQLAQEYRKRNGLAADATVPVDAVTRSGSGLDPHISPENAALQVPRVARARQLSEHIVRRLVAGHTSGRQFGLMGEPRVAVLSLNLALDLAAPSTPSTSTR